MEAWRLLRTEMRRGIPERKESRKEGGPVKLLAFGRDALIVLCGGALWFLFILTATRSILKHWRGHHGKLHH
jgi:hypothetical protein